MSLGLRHRNASLRGQRIPEHAYLPVAQTPFEPAALAVGEDGQILECSASAERLFGYRAGELPGRHVSVLLPDLARMRLTLGECVNPRLAYLSRCCVPFKAARRNGEEFTCALFFNRLRNSGAAPLLLIIRSDGGPAQEQR